MQIKNANKSLYNKVQYRCYWSDDLSVNFENFLESLVSTELFNYKDCSREQHDL